MKNISKLMLFFYQFIKICIFIIYSFFFQEHFEVDYVHGETDVMRNVEGEAECIGFMLEGMPKGDLFKTVVNEGNY